MEDIQSGRNSEVEKFWGLSKFRGDEGSEVGWSPKLKKFRSGQIRNQKDPNLVEDLKSKGFEIGKGLEVGRIWSLSNSEVAGDPKLISSEVEEDPKVTDFEVEEGNSKIGRIPKLKCYFRFFSPVSSWFNKRKAWSDMDV